MRNEKEPAAMCRAKERTFRAEAKSKEARLAGWLAGDGQARCGERECRWGDGE